VSIDQASEVRIVVITSGGDYAQRILTGLALEGVIPQALLIIQPARPRDNEGLLRRLCRRPSPRRLAAAVLRRALRAVEPATQSDQPSPWEGMAEEVRTVGPLNGQAMLEALRSLEPDYLVLAGLGILKAEALSIPRRGTFNVHPGLLPWIRGVDVIERAIQRSTPVGITAHYVNAGIDTGAIIRRELIPVHSHDTLGSLRRKAYERSARLMVELATAAAHGRHPEATTQRRRYRYCSSLTTEEFSRIEATVREGLAVKLYREWLAFYGSHIIPAGEERSPAANREMTPASEQGAAQ
jgi:methionyl-tRNA formyltransferase